MRPGSRAEWFPYYLLRGRCGVKDEWCRSIDLKPVDRRRTWHKRGTERHQRAMASPVRFAPVRIEAVVTRQLLEHLFRNARSNSKEKEFSHSYLGGCALRDGWH